MVVKESSCGQRANLQPVYAEAHMIEHLATMIPLSGEIVGPGDMARSWVPKKEGNIYRTSRYHNISSILGVPLDGTVECFLLYDAQ